MESVEDFKESMLDNVEAYLSEGDISSAESCLSRFRLCDKNVGYQLDRLKHNPEDLENAFHREWINKNIPHPAKNGGWGILQCLLTDVDIDLTERERMIAATVVQWLGTNVGTCFLEDTLALVGKKIVSKK